jgi:hypothetical protein
MQRPDPAQRSRLPYRCRCNVLTEQNVKERDISTARPNWAGADFYVVQPVTQIAFPWYETWLSLVLS